MQLESRSIKNILQSIALFTNFNLDELSQQCEELILPKYCVIAIQGDVMPSDLFLLLIGSISVHYNQYLIETPGNLHYYQNRQLFQCSQPDPNEIINFYGKALRIKKTTKFDKPKFVLFEQSMVQETLNPVTLVTQSECLFLTIHNTKYKSLMNPSLQSQTEKMQLIFKTFPVIEKTQQYSFSQKKKICELFFVKENSRNQRIELQNDNVYLVMSGEYSVFYFDNQIKGGVFGEEYAFQNRYTYKVICASSYGEIIHCSLEKLLNLFAINQLPFLQEQFFYKKSLLQRFYQKQNGNEQKLKILKLPHALQMRKLKLANTSQRCLTQDKECQTEQEECLKKSVSCSTRNPNYSLLLGPPNRLHITKSLHMPNPTKEQKNLYNKKDIIISQHHKYHHNWQLDLCKE